MGGARARLRVMRMLYVYAHTHTRTHAHTHTHTHTHTHKHTHAHTYTNIYHVLTLLIYTEGMGILPFNAFPLPCLILYSFVFVSTLN